MKNLITEINRNRALMGLNVINEGTGLAGIIDAIANGLASNMVKKVTTEVIDSFPKLFQFANPGMRTRFINGGIASLKNALGKITRKEALDIIVKVDTAQIAKLASLIEKEETELMTQIGSLVEKGVDDKTIKRSLGELTDIPDSVVNVLLSKVSIDKLFTVDRIKALAKAMEESSGKNLAKIKQTAIDAFRKSNPGASELEIAEAMVAKLPYSPLSAEKMIALLKSAGSGIEQLATKLFTSKETGKIAWGRIALYAGAGTVISLAAWAKEYLTGVLPQPTNPIDILEKDPRYSCYAGYVTPGKDDDHFVVEEANKTRKIIKYIKGRFFYVDNNDSPLSELKCN